MTRSCEGVAHRLVGDRRRRLLAQDHGVVLLEAHRRGAGVAAQLHALTGGVAALLGELEDVVAALEAEQVDVAQVA